MTSLIKKVITEFIAINKRAPDTQELKLLLETESKNKPLAMEKGVTQYDAAIARFRDVSSAEKESKTRIALLTDLIDIGTEIENLIKQLELGHQAFMSNYSAANTELNKLDAKANNSIILSDKTNIFLYGVEETFSSNSHIDLVNTTAQLVNGLCALKPTRLSRTTDFTARAGFYSPDSILAETIIGDVLSLKEDDGSFWIGTVYTASSRSEVKLILNLELHTEQDISHVIVNGIPLNTNGFMKCDVNYSINGTSFESLHRGLHMTSNTLYIPFGRTDVKVVQLVFEKERSDSITTNRQYLYSFSFDSISIYGSDYDYENSSLLFAGPYNFYTQNNESYMFSKASLSCCGMFPSGTGVRFWLSNDDQATWKSISTNRQDFISFGAVEVDYELLDSDKAPTALVENALGLETTRSRHNVFVNKYLHVDAAQAGFNHLAVTVKRGIGQWIYDETREEWKTTIEIKNPEGLRLSLGPTSFKLNGRETTGEVWLPYGYSEIRTNVSNYLEIEDNLEDINEIRRQDALYPYNHKYMIEGYSYPDSYLGPQVYVGADSFFVSKCIWLSPENFDDKPWSFENVDFYTIENVYGNYYFKLKVDKTKQDWKDEIVEVDWYTSGTSNQLWVKAELFSNDPSVTPILDKFAMRVI